MTVNPSNRLLHKMLFANQSKLLYVRFVKKRLIEAVALFIRFVRNAVMNVLTELWIRI